MALKVVSRLLSILRNTENESSINIVNVSGQIQICYTASFDKTQNLWGNQNTEKVSDTPKEDDNKKKDYSTLLRKRAAKPSIIYRKEKRRQLRISEDIFEGCEEVHDDDDECIWCHENDENNQAENVLNRDIMQYKTLGESVKDRCVITSILPQGEHSLTRRMTQEIPQTDGKNDNDKEEEDDEDDSWKVVRTRKKSIEELKTDVIELSNNYQRELWDWANKFRIDIARWERADTNGEMVLIPPALSVRNWKTIMRTIKGNEDAGENREVGGDGWINPTHPIQCKNDYLDIFYNWMANFDIGKCYWMVNDAADKAIPRPPAVHERILWRMKNCDRLFTISGPPSEAWEYEKQKARMRFEKI